jgi:hypothetical protein
MGPNEASQVVIGAVLKVHTELGAGLLESALRPVRSTTNSRARACILNTRFPVPIVLPRHSAHACISASTTS